MQARDGLSFFARKSARFQKTKIETDSKNAKDGIFRMRTSERKNKGPGHNPGPMGRAMQPGEEEPGSASRFWMGAYHPNCLAHRASSCARWDEMRTPCFNFSTDSCLPDLAIDQKNLSCSTTSPMTLLSTLESVPCLPVSLSVNR